MSNFFMHPDPPSKSLLCVACWTESFQGHKLGCLLFPISSSNIGTTSHGGDGEGKALFPPFEVSET